MIIVTGGAGFIGSNLVASLTRADQLMRSEVAVIDWLGVDDKWRNLGSSQFLHLVPPEEGLDFLNRHRWEIEAVVHLGALSSTTETDGDRIARWNIQYSIDLADWCFERGIKFCYASSAATYGDGGEGFRDDDGLDYLSKLRPLNLYGWSKHAVDLALARRGFFADRHSQIIGLKFFNVYGPNEYHKGAQQSTVSHFHRQIKETGRARLFKSYRAGVANGEQLRDFVSVKDCVILIRAVLEKEFPSGLYNIGTSQARSFNDLARAVFAAMGREPQIDYIDMPESLRDRYQYYTQSQSKGFLLSHRYLSLEGGVNDYVKNHLNCQDPYL
ncbi:MAG: ADP-glyceromanno-heptose 6-epimerase [Candidatus Pacebacteria bacterium]|nr:ADP-glyceromanno-heptose 6-epimerase [Candidatus Paceibacterota bacterium]